MTIPATPELQDREASVLESWVLDEKGEEQREVMVDALLAYFKYRRTGRAGDPELVEFGKRTYDFICQRDVLWFGRRYFPNHVSAVPAKFHRDLSRDMFKLTYLSRAAPRSHAKSTLVNMVGSLQEAAYERAKFIVIISATLPNAIDHLDAIIGELVENERLITDFPHLAPPDPLALRAQRKKKRRSRQSDFVTMGGVRFVARGAGQAIRGLKERYVRPDLVVLDDVDDDDTVRSVKMRQKLYNWFDSVVMNLEGVETMRVRAIGTIIHKRALINLLIERWNGKIWKAVIDWETKEVQWPSVWPYERLMEKRDGFIDENGKRVDGIGRIAFSREYQNDPISDTEVQLKEEWIKYKTIPEGFPYAGRLSMGVDLALSEKEESSYNALVIDWRDDRTDKIYTIYTERWRAPISETRDRIVKAARGEPVGLEGSHVDLPPCDVVAIESVQFQAAVVQDIIPRVACQVLEVVPDRDKRTRFQLLANQYSIDRYRWGPLVPAWFEEAMLEIESNDPKDAAVYAYLGIFAAGDVRKTSFALLVNNKKGEDWV